MAYALALGLKSHQLEDVLDKFRTKLLSRIPGPVIKAPWNTMFNYGIISNDIVRDVALLGLNAVHPDKQDITFEELDRDLLITGTNVFDAYFLYVLSKLLQACL